MKNIIKKVLPFIFPIVEIVFIPAIFIGSAIMFLYKRIGPRRFSICTKILRFVGVMPVYNHYYDPFYKKIDTNIHQSRFFLSELFNSDLHLSLLKKFTYKDDFNEFLNNLSFVDSSFASLDNGSYEHGDSEVLFNFVKHFKPRNIIEIGCGFSTKIIHSSA